MLRECYGAGTELLRTLVRGSAGAWRCVYRRVFP